ncbi:hypothetical protein AAFF_G00321830 [Aldrovandia affinis]|uniref:Centrosomal protein kizuna n=1 Tax=Aldrovandia affinis TaxID=143900 RepID=A0AAD7WQ56_9TELE|nr:hypothetical protein AAFF_G00321830 [Aldrovandia affinis]
MASWWDGGRPGGIEDARAPAKKRGYLGLQHRSRALQLQSQWQEVTERECRAQVRNWQLLQDFQRAQDTLSDLAARTAAMATIRVEYERKLEHHFPHWQQKLEEKKIAAQHKEVRISPPKDKVELPSKEAPGKMEEGNGRAAYSRTAKGALTPPGPSLPTPPENGDRGSRTPTELDVLSCTTYIPMSANHLTPTGSSPRGSPIEAP